MSSDNGVYIGCFPMADGSTEYRVIHAQAIENCNESQWVTREMADACRVLYYGDAYPYPTIAEAQQEAERIYNEIMSDEFYAVCEYGICEIDYDRPLPGNMTKEEAIAIFDR
jgi:hypothetical protein